jgi:hypothetical protein
MTTLDKLANAPSPPLTLDFAPAPITIARYASYEHALTAVDYLHGQHIAPGSLSINATNLSGSHEPARKGQRRVLTIALLGVLPVLMLGLLCGALAASDATWPWVDDIQAAASDVWIAGALIAASTLVLGVAAGTIFGFVAGTMLDEPQTQRQPESGTYELVAEPGVAFRARSLIEARRRQSDRTRGDSS